ncbi:MAG TPA: ATP-binding cassette domain-containing protein, partial [Longimicrobiales bacterium]|nr:ATP-binding cassette domain-containing protein [Longimicrobiales bacterium]
MESIVVQDLERRYGVVHAVRGIGFEVAEGEVFAFLGPNGAGKTTTISILCTLLSPTAGRARVSGHDVVSERPAVRRAIGVVFQEPTLDEQLTAEQNLRFHAMAYGVPREVAARRMDELLELVGLAERRGDRVRTYSG